MKTEVHQVSPATQVATDDGCPILGASLATLAAPSADLVTGIGASTRWCRRRLRTAGAMAASRSRDRLIKQSSPPPRAGGVFGPGRSEDYMSIMTYRNIKENDNKSRF